MMGNLQMNNSCFFNSKFKFTTDKHLPVNLYANMMQFEKTIHDDWAVKITGNSNDMLAMW